jgi:hypothetical protein
MIGNFPVSPISPIVSVPNALTPFQNAQVGFYDPITMRPTGTINQTTRITNYYNSNGVTVEITGTVENVKKAIGLLNIANDMPQGTSQSAQQPQDEVYPIGTPIEEILAHRRAKGLVNTNPIVNGKEWKLVSNPLNLSKFLLTTPNTSKPFSGSGVMIIEKNGNNPYVLLVRTLKRGTYEDLGGELDVNIANQNTLKDNASKEALEESQNLFVLNTIDLERQVGGKTPYIDIPDQQNNSLYRCYILVVDGTNGYDIPQFYNQNKIMTANRMGYQRDDWRESVEMRRFSLQQMTPVLNANTSGGINFNDITNVSCTIRDRTANCLRVLVSNKDLFNTLYSNPVNVRYFYDRGFASMTIGMHIFRV